MRGRRHSGMAIKWDRDLSVSHMRFEGLDSDMSIKSAGSKDAPITCPFCKEAGYDMKGFKIHLELFCPVYPKVEYK